MGPVDAAELFAIAGMVGWATYIGIQKERGERTHKELQAQINVLREVIYGHHGRAWLRGGREAKERPPAENQGPDDLDYDSITRG